MGFFPQHPCHSGVSFAVLHSAFLLLWIMCQNKKWHHVEIFPFQPDWNVMQNWTVLTLKRKHQFATLRITCFPHYLHQLKTSGDSKIYNIIRWSNGVFNRSDCTANMRRAVFQTHHLLAYYSSVQTIILLASTNKPQLMQSVCIGSLVIVCRYSGNCRKSQT